MGGGLGLALRLKQVEAREDLVLAMPETGIGLWPDVGVSFELSRAPRHVGRHLAMTGASIDAASALWAGLVDEVVDADGNPADVDPVACQLARDAVWIQECYDTDDPVEVCRRLADRPEEAARKTAEHIATRCPLSVAVALAAVIKAESASGLAEVLETDRALGTSVRGCGLSWSIRTATPTGHTRVWPASPCVVLRRCSTRPESQVVVDDDSRVVGGALGVRGVAVDLGRDGLPRQLR